MKAAYGKTMGKTSSKMGKCDTKNRAHG